MFTALILSSIASGLIATFVMLIFLYLPILWNGDYYDVLGAIGSLLTREVNSRARFLGGFIYVLAGFVFSLLYGWLALTLLQNVDQMNFPSLTLAGVGVEINSVFVLFGIVVGLGHGVIVALLATVFFLEHHPLEHFRTRFILVISQVISHLAFGITAMFFHSQFLQLLLGI